MIRPVKYPQYIPIEILETFLDGSYPTRKETGTDKDWLVRLSWLIGELYFKGKFRTQEGDRVSYSLSKSFLDKHFIRKREYINGKKVTTKYKIGPTQGDSIDKILTLCFRRGKVGSNLTGKATQYAIRDSIEDILIYSSVANKPIPKKPKRTLPRDVYIKIGKDIDSEIRINIVNTMRSVDGINLYLKQYKENTNSVSPKDFCKDILKSSVSYKEEEGYIEKIKYYRNRLMYIQLLNNNPKGYKFYQKYKVTSGGRLTKINDEETNFQTLDKVIRNIVFGGIGYKDVDVVSCHPTILNQYYKLITGKTNKWLESYSLNSKQMRYQLTNELDIHFGLGKSLLISLCYSGGSNIPISKEQGLLWLRKRERGEISFKTYDNILKFYPNNIDAVNILNRIIDSKTIQDIVTQIKGVVKDIDKVNGFGLVKDGYIKNVVGYKNYNIDKTSSKLSNILNGLETLILYTAIDLFNREMVVLYHDGFVTNEDIQPIIPLLKKRVKERTKEGLDRWFKENQIIPKTNNSGIEVEYSVDSINSFDIMGVVKTKNRRVV